MAIEINNTIEGLVEATNTAIDLVTEFGNGNFDVEIKQYPGKKEILTTSFKAVQTNLIKFVSDISGIIAGVNDGAKIATQTADALRTISNDISSVAEIITNIATSSDEQTRAVEQITEGITRITEVVKNNSSTAEKAASASQHLSSLAETLHSLVGVFNIKKAVR